MSMRHWSVNDYGLILDDDGLKVIAKNICDDYFDENWDDDDMYMEYLEYISDKLSLIYLSGFIGDVFYINDRGYDSCDYKSYYDESLYYVSLNFYPGLFGSHYENFDDVIIELKSRVGEYLPKDFDYRGNVRHLIGTYFG